MPSSKPDKDKKKPKAKTAIRKNPFEGIPPYKGRHGEELVEDVENDDNG